MSLRDKIAKIITPTGASGFPKADKVIALLREEGLPLRIESFFGEAEAWRDRVYAIDLGETT